MYLLNFLNFVTEIEVHDLLQLWQTMDLCDTSHHRRYIASHSLLTQLVQWLVNIYNIES